MAHFTKLFDKKIFLLKLSSELFSQKKYFFDIAQKWIKIFKKFQQIQVQQDNSKTKVKNMKIR